VPITTNVVSSSPAQVIHQYVIKFVWFSLGTQVSSTNKTYRPDITEILLKVALNTITLSPSLGNSTTPKQILKQRTIEI